MCGTFGAQPYIKVPVANEDHSACLSPAKCSGSSCMLNSCAPQIQPLQFNPRSLKIRDSEDRALFPFNDNFIIPETVQILHVEGTARSSSITGICTV